MQKSQRPHIIAEHQWYKKTLNNYSMSLSWIWSNQRARSNKGEWNNCFSKFSNRPADFYFGHYRGLKLKTSCGIFLNLAHYFPYDVKLRLLAHSRSFLANQKARNAIVGAENLLIQINSYGNNKYKYRYREKKKRSNTILDDKNLRQNVA